jgi:hypothetical protein
MFNIWVFGLAENRGSEYAHAQESRTLIRIRVFSTWFFLAGLKMIFNFPLAPGVPGEGPDCHFPKEIVGFGPIPARILGF